MNRPITIIALILAILSVVFYFGKMMPDYQNVLTYIAILLLAIGVLTGL